MKQVTVGDKVPVAPHETPSADWEHARMNGKQVNRMSSVTSGAFRKTVENIRDTFAENYGHIQISQI